jgi:predicted GNAT family N-acyltransferase
VTVRETQDPAEISAALDLRERVFCGEQGVSPSEEIDEYEATATQVVALDDSGVVATCRLRRVDDGWKLERMAVERRLRGAGVGRRLLAGAEEIARAGGADRMLLHAQTAARGFYESSGYVPEGDVFMEAEIEHIRMSKPLAAARA